MNNKTHHQATTGRPRGAALPGKVTKSQESISKRYAGLNREHQMYADRILQIMLNRQTGRENASTELKLTITLRPQPKPEPMEAGA